MQIAELFASLGLKVDQGQWSAGTKAIEGVKKAVVGLATMFAAKKIEDGVMAVVDYGSKLNDLSQKTGLGARSLQELGYIAAQNSSNMDDLSGAVVKLSKGLDEARVKGTGPAHDALQRLGLSMRDPTFAAKNLDEKFTTISQKLAKLPDGTTKTALAMDLFGRSGASLIPTMNDLAANGDELRAKFKALHGELSDDDVKGMDRFGDTMVDVKGSVSGLWRELVAKMIPTLQTLADKFLKWFAANRELISQKIVAFAEALGSALVAVGDALGVVIDFVDEHGDVFKAFLIAIAAILGLIAIESVIAFLPVLALIAAVALLVYGIKKLIDYGPQIKHALGSAFDWVKSKVHGAWESIKGVGHAVYEFFADVGRTIKNAFQAVVDWFSAKIDWVVDKYNKVVNAFHKVKGALTDVVGNVDAGTGTSAYLNHLNGTEHGEVYTPFGIMQSHGNSTTNNVSAGAVQVTINGGDPQQVKSGVIAAMSEFWDGQMRDANAATGGADQ